MAKNKDYAGTYKYRTSGGKKYNFNVASEENKKAPMPKPRPETSDKPAVVMPTRPISLTPPANLGTRILTGSVRGGTPQGYDQAPSSMTGGTKNDDGTFMGDPLAEDRPPLFNKGGAVRGDGVCRVKTKGRNI
jgi:hypothetical protein